MKYVKYLIIIFLVAASGAGGYFLTKKNSEKVLGETKVEEKQPQAVTPQPSPSYEKTVGDFLVTNNEVCKENGKPVIYFFGSTGCSHCVWEKPVIQKVVKNFEGLISYHENIDNQNDAAVFEKYKDINPGYIPFLVFGCKYARVGSGESIGEEKEVEALSAIICKLTEGKPGAVCDLVKDKTSEIK